MSGVVADPGLGQFQNGLQLINKPCRFLKKISCANFVGATGFVAKLRDCDPMR
jgi:hypothetical protein